jgi:hypothetical protein
MKTEYTIVEIKDNVNLHYKLEKEPDEYMLNRVTFFPYSNPLDFLRVGRFKIQRFMAIVDKEGASFSFDSVSKEVITSEDLYIAQQSTALSKAIKGLFASALPGKKMIFFIVIGIAAVLIVLQLSGQLNILKLVGL